MSTLSKSAAKGMFMGLVFAGTTAMADGFATKQLPLEPTHVAPDGLEVRELHTLTRGGMAHFKLAPGHTSKPSKHRSIEEIWYFISGRGEMWRRDTYSEQIVDVFPGVSITIPPNTEFQIRSTSDEPLEAIGQTMPPWPGPEEAIQNITGKWTPTVGGSVE